MRELESKVVRNEVTTNRYVWFALLLCTCLLLAAVFIPPLAKILSVVNPGLSGWIIILVSSFIPMLSGQLYLFFNQNNSK
jgi:Ca2+-transporting ATPase